METKKSARQRKPVAPTPAIRINLGELPPFWDRNVIFFSNLHSVFYDNDEQSQQLLQGIAGASGYGGRVLAILNLLFRRRPNLIVLEKEADATLTRYLSGVLGLSLPDQAVLDQRGYRTLVSEAAAGGGRGRAHRFFEKLRRNPAVWVDGFVTDTGLATLAAGLGKQTISTLEGSKRGNNKYLLYRYQQERGLPVFDTMVAAGRDELPACLVELRRKGYAKAVVKAQIGASGYGMVKLETEDYRPEAVPDYLFFEGPCMVQGWIEGGGDVESAGSPSVQLFLSDDTLFLFDLTEQVLDREGVHEGNLCPPPYLQERPELRDELLRQASLAGEWLFQQGYRGTASTDFLMARRGEKTQAILCEINARVTGATYPAILARRFNPKGAWYMRNIGFRKAINGEALLSIIDDAKALYRPGAARGGILPFNFNTDSEGNVMKGQFLCLGENYEQCAGLFALAWSRLPVEWGYDRD